MNPSNFYLIKLKNHKYMCVYIHLNKKKIIKKKKKINDASRDVGEKR